MPLPPPVTASSNTLVGRLNLAAVRAFSMATVARADAVKLHGINSESARVPTQRQDITHLKFEESEKVRGRDSKACS